MIYSRSALNKLMRDIIDSIVAPGYAIEAEQGAPRKTTGYCSVKVSSSIQIGHPDVGLVNQAEPEEDIEVTREFSVNVMYSVNFYKEQANDNAALTRSALRRESVDEQLRAGGAGFIEVSSIRDLSELMKGAKEERAQMDITLNIVTSDVEAVRSMLGVDIQLDQQINNETNTNLIEVK